jgi:hypothetical protein
VRICLTKRSKKCHTFQTSPTKSIHQESTTHPTLQRACSRIPQHLTGLLDWTEKLISWASATYHFIGFTFMVVHKKPKCMPVTPQALQCHEPNCDVAAMLFWTWQETTYRLDIIHDKNRSLVEVYQTVSTDTGPDMLINYKFSFLMLKLYSSNCYNFPTAVVCNQRSLTNTRYFCFNL